MGSRSIIKFSPNGTNICFWRINPYIYLFDIKPKKAPKKIENCEISSIEYSLDSKIIFLADKYNYISMYHIQNNTKNSNIGSHEGEIYCMQFLKNSTLISSSYDETIIMWNIKEKKKEFILKNPSIGYTESKGTQPSAGFLSILITKNRR